MRVLVIEDEASVRTFLCRAVACLMPGAHVVAEVDGRQGLLSFLASPADLVISDNRMPLMSGLELLHVLRERSAVPFIMVSAEPSFERSAIQAGASACIGKPLTLSDLREAICSALATSMSYTEPCAK